MNPVKIETKYALELACASQRQNNAYLKSTQPVYSDEGSYLHTNYSNKTLILNTALGVDIEKVRVTVTEEDTALAEEIIKYFRRLIFHAVIGDNNFYTDLNIVLNKSEISSNEIGFIACLPSVYAREKLQSELKKAIRNLDDQALGDKDTIFFNLECEIINFKKSNNFDAINVEAIINNRLVSWFAKTEPKLGPAILLKGKVKEVRNSFKWKITETRLNYVKIAQ